MQRARGSGSNPRAVSTSTPALRVGIGHGGPAPPGGRHGFGPAARGLTVGADKDNEALLVEKAAMDAGTSQLNLRIDRKLHNAIARASRVRGVQIQRYVADVLSAHLQQAAKTGEFAAAGSDLDAHILRLSARANEMIVEKR